MKKVLLGTTALVMTAGVAAAEVSLSGYAEIGVFDNDNGDGVQFHHDMDVKFSLSGESDNGLSFGATIDLDEVGDDSHDDGGGDGISNAGTGPIEEHSVWVSGSFGTITMGDTDGAFDWALTEVGSLTSLTDDHTSHGGYRGNSGLDGGNDGQILRYDNSVGDISFGLSAEMDDTGGGVGDIIGVGVKGSFGDFGWGLGYQDSDADTVVGVSLSANLGDISAVLNYTDGDTSADHAAIGLTYSTGALSLHANYGDNDGGASGFGLAANYDLGGGAVAMFGYGDTDGGSSTWSAGLGLSF